MSRVSLKWWIGLIVLLEFLMFFLISGPVSAQTTGKITGTVIDAETEQPLIGVNVIVEGTSLGSATNQDGRYFILQVPPGEHTVIARYIGYATTRKEGVVVNVDRTATVNFSLESEAIAGEAVTVTAERDVVRKDVSSSMSEIPEQSAVETPSVKSLKDLLLLQPGIELGGSYMEGDSHAYQEGISIRGGKIEETDFRIDGLSVKDSRQGTQSNEVALTSIQEVQIIRGGFNAEYGDIRSGVVNVVTKDARGSGTKLNVSAMMEYTPARLGHWGENYYSYNSDRSVLYPYLGPESMDGYTYTFPDGTTREVFQGWKEYAANLPADHPFHNDPEAAREKFAWESRPQPYGDNPDITFDGTISGALPFIKNVGFVLSNVTNRLDYPFNAPVSRKVHIDNSTYLKLRFNPTSNLQILAGGQYGELHSVSAAYRGVRPGSYWQIEDPSHLFSLNNHFWNNAADTPIDQWRRRYILKATYTFSPRTYLEFEVNHQRNSYWAMHTGLRDMSNVKAIPTNNDTTVYLDNRPFGYFGGYKVKNILGYYVAGHGTRRDKSKVRTTRINLDFVSQLGEYNEIKSGIDYVYDNIDNYWGQHRAEKGLKREWYYHVKPMLLSGYLQDKLEFRGMIANIGVRLDMSDPSDSWFEPNNPWSRWFEYGMRHYDGNVMYPEEPWSEVETVRVDSFQYRPMSDIKPKFALSPRIGISHPIGPNSKLFFNYGHFYQRPPIDEMFRMYFQGVTDMELQDYGNANLDFMKTVAFELGAEQDLWNSINIRLTGYYKDVTNELVWINYNGMGSIDYSSPLNNGYRDIRGAELEIRKRAGRFIQGYLSYDYRITSSGRIGDRDIYQDPDEKPRIWDPKQSQPVPEPRLNATFSFTTPIGYGPSVGGLHPLGGWYANVLFRWQQGRYFTYNPEQLEGIENNMQWTDSHNTDLRFGRNFQFDDNIMARLYVEVRNVFNAKFIAYPPDGETIPSAQWTRYMDSLKPGDRVGEWNTDEKPYLKVPRMEQLLFTNRPREFSLGLRISY